MRTGDLADLVGTLRQIETDRAELGEVERASEAARAAQALERGDEAAYFERVIYGVGDPDRWSVVSGSREQIVAELADAAAGWEHQGKPELAAEAVTGLEVVRGGALSARVGHLLYVVCV